jgi:hypothetical protein
MDQEILPASARANERKKLAARKGKKNGRPVENRSEYAIANTDLKRGFRYPKVRITIE